VLSEVELRAQCDDEVQRHGQNEARYV